MKKQRITAAAILIMTLASLTACSFRDVTQENATDQQETQESTTERVDTGFVLTGPDSFDSADTPVIVEIDKTDNTVTFLNLELSKKYTLSYDGTTKLCNKYGESISLEQIKEGDIVDVKFLKSKKHLTSMQLSAQAWSNNNVERYEINTVRGEVTIGQDIYKISDNTQYLSNGRSIYAMDLNPSDVLTFQGIGNEILSINVERGHGYLRLANDEYFIGGWIEIGQSLIKQITEDMLLTVPEGSYQVNISHNGNGGVKNIVINRNEETTLDIGDFEIAEPSYGTVLFSVTPSSTQIYIDGEKIDASLPVSLEYGIHQLIAKADGYQTITRYLRVGEESAGFDIVLDAINDDDDEEESSSESETSTETDEVTDYYKVYIDAPSGVEVYLDGNYVGISPCSFRKTEGSHTITLRKTGYEPRSYTIQIDDEEKDFSYSFVDLVPLAGTETTESITETEPTEAVASTEASAESTEASTESAEIESTESVTETTTESTESTT